MVLVKQLNMFHTRDWNKVNANIKTFIAECGETWTVKCMPTVSIVSLFGLKDLYKWWYQEVRQEVL